MGVLCAIRARNGEVDAVLHHVTMTYFQRSSLAIVYKTLQPNSCLPDIDLLPEFSKHLRKEIRSTYRSLLNIKLRNHTTNEQLCLVVQDRHG